jgi:hypothetical protein
MQQGCFPRTTAIRLTKTNRKHNIGTEGFMPISQKNTTILPATLFLCFVGLVLPGFAQQPTPAEVEKLIRDAHELWNAGDPAKFPEITFGGYGFGIRNRAPRPPIDKKTAIEFAQKSYKMVEYDHATLDEIHTAVDGDIGMAWGFYTESSKRKGQEPEVVHVRFTITLKKDAKGWRTLLYHRDAQQFDNQGNYIPPPKPALK